MKWKILFILLTLSFAANACDMKTQIYLPAVQKTDYGYRGVLAKAYVEIRPGSGHVFVDTFPLTEIDTQASARLSRDVAFQLAKKNPSNYDVFYTIRSESPIIGGPSAGGALTVATLSALFCLNVSSDVIMTGTINPDGSIGPVGGIFEKAGVSAEHGAKYFLIPKGQSIITVQKTEKTQLPFGVQIVSRPITIDVKSYAKEHWNMSVVEISDVREALKYMTGYEIVEPRRKVVRNEKVKQIMKDVAEEMMAITREKLDETKKNLDAAKISIEYLNELKKLYQEQEERYEDAQSFYNDEKYYSAASYSFGIWVKCSYIDNIIMLSKENKYALKRKMTDVEERIRNVKELINDSKSDIDATEDIEIIALAEERINDADSYMEKAWKSYYENSLIEACYNVAYAEERARTAEIWINLTSEFQNENATLTFNMSSIKSLTERRLEDARTSILYAETIVDDVSEAENLLELAERNYNYGDYSSALMDAIMAKAMANIYMETRGLDEERLKEKAKEFETQAENAISDAMSKGYTPLVAINYLEYGKTLDDVNSKLVYFKYAAELAKLTEDINSYTPVEEEEVIVRRVEKKCKDVQMLLIGFVAGIIVFKFKNLVKK